MKLMTQSRAVIAAVAAGAGFICNAGTVAWYRFDEGTLGERVGSTVEIVNSANPGTLTGYCRQQNTSAPVGVSAVDTGYFPMAVAGFNAGNGVIDPVSREKLPNRRAFSFTTSKWGVYDSGTSYYVSKGDGGCVTVPQTAALHLSSFTVECFFKMDPIELKDGETNNSSEQILVCLPSSTDYSTPGRYAFALYVVNKTGRVYGLVWNGSSWKGVSSSEGQFNVIDGKWHHAAVTFNGDSRELAVYVDYTLAQKNTSTFTPGYDSTCSFPLTIGAEPMSWGRRFTGAIDEVRNSDTVLATTEFLRPGAYVSEIDAPATVCHVTFDTAASEEFGFPLWKEVNAVPFSGAIPAEVKWDATKGVEPELVKDSLPVIEVYNARRKFNKTLTNAVALHAPTNQPFYSASLFIDDRKNGAHAVLDGSFTLEFFARVPAKPVGVYNDSAYLAFFGKAWSGGPMSIRVHKNGGLAFCLKDQDTNTEINDWSSAGQICDNEWHHIALTYDRPVKTAKAYLDGNLVKTWDGNMNIDFKANDSDNSKMLEIGSGYGPGSDHGYSTGPWIDEFRLSNVALDPRDFLQGKQTRFTGMSVFVR